MALLHISHDQQIFPHLPASHHNSYSSPRPLELFHVKGQTVACFPQGWEIEPGTMPLTPYAPTKTKEMMCFLTVDKAMLSRSPGVGSTPAVERNEVMQAPLSRSCRRGKQTCPFFFGLRCLRSPSSVIPPLPPAKSAQGNDGPHLYRLRPGCLCIQLVSWSPAGCSSAEDRRSIDERRRLGCHGDRYGAENLRHLEVHNKALSEPRPEATDEGGE